MLRARSSSCCVKGVLPSDSSVPVSVFMAASRSLPGGNCAPNIARPGSRFSMVKPNTPEAIFVATSAWYRRPDGVSDRITVARSSGTKSGLPAAGMWYMAATSGVPPVRRKVTERSPSCTGSTVYSGGNLRSGLGSLPSVCSMSARVAWGSNLPATISTALSGW
ncbi:hypothetical protein D3C86_1232710 [compost metagenome]